MSRRVCNVEHVPGGAFRCWREPGHAGAHAYGTTNATEPVPPAQCGATWDFYVTDAALTTYNVTCILPRGHDLDHQGTIGWPS